MKSGNEAAPCMYQVAVLLFVVWRPGLVLWKDSGSLEE